MPNTEYEAEEVKNIDGDELIASKRRSSSASAGGMKTTRDEFNPSSADEQHGDGVNNEQEEATPPKKRQKIAGPRVVPLQHKTDSDKLATNQILLETASRVDDVISELIEYAQILADASKKNEGAKLNTAIIHKLKASIVPMLHIASKTIKDTSSTFAPFGGTAGLHARADVQRKKEVVKKTIVESRSSAIQMIDHFVTNSIVHIPPQLSAFIAGEELQQKKNVNKTVSILRPYNGSVYTKSEAIYTVQLYAKRSRQRALAIRAMISKGYVKAVSVKAIQRIVNDFEVKGIVPEYEIWDECGVIGRPSIYKHPSFEAAAASAAAQPKPVGPPKLGDLIQVTLTDEKEKKMTTKKDDDVGDKIILDGESYNIVAATKKKSNDNATLDKGKMNTKKKASAAPKSPYKQSTAASASAVPATKPSSHELILSKEFSTTTTHNSLLTKLLPSGKVDMRGKHKRKPKPKVAVNITLPLPHSGSTYTKTEAARIVCQYAKGSCERQAVCELMIKLGFVPSSYKSITRLVQQYEKGEVPILDTEWTSINGRPPLLTNEDVTSIIDNMKANVGKVYSKAEFECIIRDGIRAKIVNIGGDPDATLANIATHTIKNYYTLFRSKLDGTYWKETDDFFPTRIEELKLYKLQYGHMDVRRDQDLGLYNFSRNVRFSRKNTKKGGIKLTPLRISSLDAIGFDWRGADEVEFVPEERIR